MGDKVTLGESLMITIFSMLIVFVVLIAISYLISILKTAINRKEFKEESKEVTAKKEISNNSKLVTTDETVDNRELIAVITAAIAASMGIDAPKVNIKTVRRTSSVNPIWSEAGRREQILNRL